MNNSFAADTCSEVDSKYTCYSFETVIQHIKQSEENVNRSRGDSLVHTMQQKTYVWGGFIFKPLKLLLGFLNF